MNKLILIGLGFFVLGCSEEIAENDIISVNDRNYEFSAQSGEYILSDKEVQESEHGVLLSGISYEVHAVSAIDYLTRKGENIRNQDRDALSKESVIMLEIEKPGSLDNIFESSEIELDKDAALQYLVGKVVDDVTIKQGGKEFHPTGSFYEGQVGANNRIRITLFTSGLSLKSEYSVVYYDRLFGQGLVKIRKNRKEIIS